MPASLFVAWTVAAGQRTAAAQLRATHAVQLGAGAIMADEKGRSRVRSAFRSLYRAAGLTEQEDD